MVTIPDLVIKKGITPSGLPFLSSVFAHILFMFTAAQIRSNSPFTVFIPPVLNTKFFCNIN